MRRVLLAVCFAAALIPIPAVAQTTQSGPAVEMRVTSFTPFNDSTHAFSAGVEVHNRSGLPIQDAAIRLTIYRRVLSRSELGFALDGHPQSDVIAVSTEQLASELEPNQTQQVVLNRDLSTFANLFRPGRRGTPGVYPVQIEATGSNGTLATEWTALVYLSVAPVQRINVAWVVALDHAPVIRPDGTYEGAAVDGVFTGATSRLVAAMSAHGTLPLTLAPSGLLLDEAAGIEHGYERRMGSKTQKASADDDAARGAATMLASLRAWLEQSGPELALTPYASGDIVSLVHGDMVADATSQLSRDASAVQAHLGRAPDRDLFLPAGLALDSRAASTVGGAGVRTVVVDPAFVPPPQGIFGPDRPVLAEGRDGVRLTALLADAPIRARLENPAPLADPQIQAQDVIAQLASAWFERPAEAAGRSVVIATATTPTPEVFSALADGLSASPWVQMRRASELAGTVAPREDPQPLTLGSVSSRALIDSAKAARRTVDIIDRIAVSPAEQTAMLDRLVLASESATWPAAAGVTLANETREQAVRTLSKIHAVPRHVTLTSRTGLLPVTVLNETGFAVRVRVLVSSAKVRFPRGNEQTKVLSERVTRLDFPASAIAAGAFAVTVEIRTTTGNVVVGDSQVTVRSTAVSSVALVATGGAALFLLFSWARKNARKRSPGAQPV